jgi:hypothetical protein
VIGAVVVEVAGAGAGEGGMRTAEGEVYAFGTPDLGFWLWHVF